MKTRSSITLVTGIVMMSTIALERHAFSATPERREITRGEERMMKVTARDVDRAMRSFRINLRDIEWGKEKRGTRTTVITLEPGLKRLGKEDAIDVEAFFVGIDNSGSQRAGWWLRAATMGNWVGSMLESRVPIRFYPHDVSKGPYLDPRWDENRHWYQKAAMGWGRHEAGVGIESSKTAMAASTALWIRGHEEAPLEREEDVRRFAAKWKTISFDEWKYNLRRPEIVAAMRQANERWAEIAIRGSDAYAKAFRGIPGPVLLINGKYLITANTMKRGGGRAIENAYRTANWLIRQEIENLVREHPDTVRVHKARRLGRKSIGYGEEAGADRGRVIVLNKDERPPSDSKVVVERFYSYGTRLERELERGVERWAKTLPKDVQLIESPVAMATDRRAPSERIHQELIVAAGAVGWENTVRHHLRRRLTNNGEEGRLQEHEDLEQFLHEIGMPIEDYERGKRESARRLADIDERYAQAEEHAGTRLWTGPVLLVNGRHLIVGGRFETLEQAFRTANLMIREERSRGAKK